MCQSKGHAGMEGGLKAWPQECADPGHYDLGAQLSAMIGGSVVVETVFAWPGIGTLIVSSAQQRDFPVVVFGVLVISASVTFVNLLVDLSYGLLDPRIRDH